MIVSKLDTATHAWFIRTLLACSIITTFLVTIVLPLILTLLQTGLVGWML
jgi:hypothetical protein